MNDIWKIGIVLIAISLITCGAVGYGIATGMFKGEKGDKGNTGLIGPQGIKGDKGDKGDDGLDAPINQKPYIEILDSSGNFIWLFPSILHYCKYTYGLRVYIDDPENDMMRITFYYSDNYTGKWIDIATFFGGDGKYGTTVDFTYTTVLASKKTIYWLVEAWDGQDITTITYPYTIIP